MDLWYWVRKTWEMSWEIPLSNLPLQVWPCPMLSWRINVSSPLSCGRLQPWRPTNRALSYVLRAIYSLWQCGVGGNPCMVKDTLLWRLNDSSYNVIYTKEFPNPSVAVTTIIILIIISCLISFCYSSFNIFPSFAIHISCTVVLCKHLLIVDAGDGFFPEKVQV